MKILLANPSCKQNLDDRYEKYYIRAGSRWPHSGVKRAGTVPHYLPFPFFLGYAAAILIESGFEVHALDAIALDVSEESFLQIISDLLPDILFFEVTTPTINYDLELVRKIKVANPELMIAIGGAHATTYAAQLLGENPSIEFIFKGEYELALNDLAISIRDGGSRPVRGIFESERGKNVSIEGFPLPAYEIFPSNNMPDPTVYCDGFCQMHPAIQMQSSRGCPHRCYFCLWNSVMYGHGRYRMISPVRVVDQMEHLAETYKAREIYFDDDSFTVSRSHVMAICDELIRRKLGVKWSCMADVAGLDDQLLRIMAGAGCIGVKFGVESASERVLKGIGKPVDLEKVKQIVSWCRKLKIKSHATFAIGLLDETDADMQQTLDFAQNLGADSIQISIATPLPGTRFFDIANDKGGLAGIGWECFDGKVSSVYGLSHLHADAEKLRRRAMFVWILKTVFNPSRLYHNLHIVFRTIRGMGIGRFCSKFSATLTDELKNR